MGDHNTATHQVVKILTTDGGETVLDPDFVAVCSEVMKKVQEAGNCGEVTMNLPDICVGGLQGAIKYWEESKAVTFNSAAYLGTVTGDDNEDFQDLVMAAKRLGYDLLFEDWVNEYRRRLHIQCQDPRIKDRDRSNDKILTGHDW